MDNDLRRVPVAYQDQESGEMCWCSPGCGFHCRQAAYDQATAEAAALAASLGSDWVPEVWENCGWCYAVRSGVVRIHPSRRGSGVRGGWEVVGYTCFINSARQFIANASSPHEAFREASEQALAASEKILADTMAAWPTEGWLPADRGEANDNGTQQL